MVVAIISLTVGIRLEGRNPKLPRSINIFSPALPQQQLDSGRGTEMIYLHLVEMANEQ